MDAFPVEEVPGAAFGEFVGPVETIEVDAEGSASDAGGDDESAGADDVVSGDRTVSSASATTGVVPNPTPTPSATASAPTRPMNLPALIVAPFVVP